jgi:hypothetical protein
MGGDARFYRIQTKQALGSRLCYAFAMAEPFTLTAIPNLLPEGEFKGHLETITFVASDGYTTHAAVHRQPVSLMFPCDTREDTRK